MKIAIHQPNYLPYIGYFEKMAMADLFVFLDNVQFSKDSYTQRMKIRTRNDSAWCTIPISNKYHFLPIIEVLLPDDTKWLKTHKNTLLAHYSKTPFFDSRFIEEYYSDYFRKLVDFNQFGIKYLKKKFDIPTETMCASELNLGSELKSNNLLLEIVEKVGGDTYISGTGARKYFNEEAFHRQNIRVEYTAYIPRPYKQRWPGFVSHLSAIDIFFNCGKLHPDPFT